MSTGERRTFPLVPRRRLTGLPFGDLPSRRRGHGSDVIGSRPYAPGDPVAAIDWFATARASSATGGDEFIVRDRAADEAPRVVLVVDRRPAMDLYPDRLPWLSKRDALHEIVAAIVASAAAARADVAALDHGEGDAHWLPPGRRGRGWEVAEREWEAPFRAPDDTLERAFAFLGQRRTEVPPATFVFVISDFLVEPSAETWQDAVRHGWDLVPVVVQDPVWERSFPAVGGVAVPVSEPGREHTELVRLSRRQAARRRLANEQRYSELLAELESFGLTAVQISDADPPSVDGAFIEWAEARRRSRWAR